MNKLLKQSIGRLSPKTPEPLDEEELLSAESALESLEKAEARIIKARNVNALTDSIVALVGEDAMNEKENEAKLALLSTRLSQAFGGLDEELFAEEEEVDGNENLAKTLGITAVLGVAIAGVVWAFTVVSTLLTFLAIYVAIVVIANKTIETIYNYSKDYGDPIDDVLTYKGLSKIGKNGDLFLFDTGINDMVKIAKSFKDAPAIVKDIIRAKASDDMSGLEKAVKKLADAFGAKTKGTDGRFGKGITYFKTDALPGDKAIFVLFDGENVPSVKLDTFSKTTVSYPTEVRGMPYGDIESLGENLLDLAKKSAEPMKNAKGDLEKFAKEIPSFIEGEVKGIKDEAEQKAAIKAYDKAGKEALIIFKIYATYAKYLESTVKGFDDFIGVQLRNLQKKKAD